MPELIKLSAVVLTVIWAVLYWHLARQIATRVVVGEPAKNLKHSAQVDTFVFMYVFLRRYRHAFGPELSRLGDTVVIAFLVALTAVAYVLAGA